MKKFIAAAGILALTAGVAVAQQAPHTPSTTGEDHGPTSEPTPTPTPTPTPSPTPAPEPTTTAPVGPTQ